MIATLSLQEKHFKVVHLRRASACSMKVYTRTGDDGTSSLFNGERRSKVDAAFIALGDVDELNANMGLAREFCLDISDQEASDELCRQLAIIQSRLLDVGSSVATPITNSSETKLSRTQYDAEHTTQLENWIDSMDTDLPTLKNFILPSGGKASAHLHVTRAVCRRAERSVLALCDNVPDAVRKYLNRLSDYLFTAARFAALKEGREEVAYKKDKE